jgi:hypothetical protein
MNSIYHCPLRVGGKTIVLNEAGDTTVKVRSADEAKELYERILVAIDAIDDGQFDEKIEDHLRSIPPRRPWTHES